MRTWVSSSIVGKLTDLDEDSRQRVYSSGRDKSDIVLLGWSVVTNIDLLVRFATAAYLLILD